MTEKSAAPSELGEARPLNLLTFRIYYEDTDFSGFVYHANYLRFMERGRTEWLRELGVDQRSAFAMSPPLAFVVRRMRIDYLRPALMDDLVTVETGLAELRGASLDLTQRVRRGDDLLVEALVTVACLLGGKPARLPRLIRDAVAASKDGS